MFSKLSDAILKYYQPEEIFIYGSYAKGTQTDQSDIDVCILMPPSWQGARHNFELNKVLTKAIGKDVHVVFCNQLNGWCVKSIYKRKPSIAL